MKKNRIIVLFLLALPVGLWAQGDLDNILRGSAADAKLLATGYVKPMLKAWGAGLNQGWYNTAKPHKFPGFDLTLSVSPVKIPTADQFFEVDNTQLSNNMKLETSHTGSTVAVTGKGQVPTMFGPNSTQAGFRLFTPTTPPVAIAGTNGRINSPPGVGIKFLPVPIANLGIGLPKGFDLKLRFVPTIDLSKFSSDITGEFKLFGVGVMHDVKQYIPGIKDLPFDMSAFIGYTSMKLDVGLDASKPDQKATFESTATTIQALISKKIAVLTVYGGLGYNIAKTTLDIKGNYDLDNNGTAETPLNFNVDGSVTGPRMTAGLRLKLAVITFHGDYTLQEYSTVTAGFGINVR
jgi:hypothetical protein